MRFTFDKSGDSLITNRDDAKDAPLVLGAAALARTTGVSSITAFDNAAGPISLAKTMPTSMTWPRHTQKMS